MHRRIKSASCLIGLVSVFLSAKALAVLPCPCLDVSTEDASWCPDCAFSFCGCYGSQQCPSVEIICTVQWEIIAGQFELQPTIFDPCYKQWDCALQFPGLPCHPTLNKCSKVGSPINVGQYWKYERLEYCGFGNCPA